MDLPVKTYSLLVVTQFSNSCKYDCCCLAAVPWLKYCVRIVRSTTSDSSYVRVWGCCEYSLIKAENLTVTGVAKTGMHGLDLILVFNFFLIIMSI